MTESGDDPVKVEMVVKVTTRDGSVTTVTVPHIDMEKEGSQLAMRTEDSIPKDQQFAVVGKGVEPPPVPQRIMFAIRGILVPDDEGRTLTQTVTEPGA